MSNKEVDAVLEFCLLVGLEVVGVLTKKGLTWSEDYVDRSDVDAIFLVGGFERKEEKVLVALTMELEYLFRKDPELDPPIFFLGSKELLIRIREQFSRERTIFLVPELWPKKEKKDFLYLFLELQQIDVAKSIRQDALLATVYEHNDVEIESGYSALISALFLATEKFKGNVLLVDIGSRKSIVSWSRYTDNLQVPVFDGAKMVDYMFHSERQQGEAHFGFRMFPEFGLGSSLEKAITQIEKEEIKEHWPKGVLHEFEDRVLNHVSYPSVSPDEYDLLWQGILVRNFLRRVWKILPREYVPEHIILSGSVFGRGKRLEYLLRTVLLPSKIPFSSKIWVNDGPYLATVGLLSKQEADIDRIDITRFLYHAGDYLKLAGKSARKGIMATVVVDIHKQDVEEDTIKLGSVKQVFCNTDHKALVIVRPTSKAYVVGHKKGEEVIFRTQGGE